MNFQREKIINICDKIILLSIYAIAFFLPISKAIIESFSYLAIACFLIKKFIQKDDIPRSPLNLLIILYVIICFFSIFISSNHIISLRSFLGKIMQDVVFFFVVVDTLNSERRFKNLIYILFFSSAVLGIDGIYQHFTHKDFLRNRPDLAIQRIYASFGSPNDFGCYLIAVIPFTLSIFFIKFRFKFFRFLIAALFVLLFTCLILTVSRGAWLAFLISALFMGVWLIPLAKFFLFLGLFVTASLAFLPPFIKERLTNLFVFLDHSGIDRKMIWEAAWKMFISKPWFGLGLGTFMFNFEKFVSKGYPYGIPYAHNCYLQMASEIGIIGLASFLSILAFFFYNGIKIMRKAQKTFSWYVLLGSLTAVLGYCVQMGVDTFLYSVDLGLLFWLMLGISVAAARQIEWSIRKL